MWRAKINASTAKYEAPDEVDPVVTLGGPHPEKDDLALLAVDSTLDRDGLETGTGLETGRN